MLFDALRKARGAYSLGGESHRLIETIASLHPAGRGWTSNRLVAADLTPPIADELLQRFRFSIRDREGRPAPPTGYLRMIEKTPKNSLRVPFFHKLFPDALFVFLYRDWRQTLASIVEAWLSGRFVTYPRLPGWPAPAWSLLLIPGWDSLPGRSLFEIAARQWSTAIDILLDDLDALVDSPVVALDYARLVATPDAAIKVLCAALDLDWDMDLGDALPLSPTTVSVPTTDKWRRYEREILAMEPLVAATDRRARRFMERYAICG